MKTKNKKLVTQRSHVKGFMKTHAFLLLLSAIGTCNHGDTTFCERQGIVDVQGPVVDNSYVSNHGIIILLAINKKYINVKDIQCDIVTRTEKERASLTFKYT